MEFSAPKILLMIFIIEHFLMSVGLKLENRDDD